MVGDILQPTHLIFILVVALLVLGPKRLPEVGRSLGNGLRDFRSALSGEHRDEDEVQIPTRPENRQPVAPVEPEAEPEPVAQAEPTQAEPTEHAESEAQTERVDQPEHVA